MQPVLMAVPGLGRLPPALQWEPVALKELELVDHRMWGPLVLLALERLEGRGSLQRAAQFCCSIPPVYCAQHCAPLCEPTLLTGRYLKSLVQQRIGLESRPAGQGQGRRLPEVVRPAGRGRPLQGLQNAHGLGLLSSLLFLEALFC